MPLTYRCLGLLGCSWLLLNTAAGQSKLNPQLKRELDSLAVADQHYRRMLMGGPNAERQLDSVGRAAGIPPQEVGPYIAGKMIAQDSANIRRVAEIIARYGYPGKRLVGTPTNEVALLVIQHSSRLPKYLPLVKRAAQRGEVPFYLYARMLDRYLMWQGHEQLYGTQTLSVGVVDVDGKPATESFVWPIHDAANVNKRRRQAGFSTTVEANAKSLGIEYKPVPLDKAQRLLEPMLGRPINPTKPAGSRPPRG
ncbi:DUF6624 domain-containing protein [Hymenobacter latericus]|uniref:DUF6624 domain-containing protein n=1 Tax=Hymenobacter sp. YIM 151858-1 TaxID=2987688 RepID=UPI002227B82E|nr:DUF6624 domain-containing protein [Hymenobacter sp. YIM 151858-1]UYZ59171.1 hypothetical protein OIS50_19230 [Hymenobacter sp. YIM 151858-1]